MERYALSHWLRARLKVKGLDLLVPLAETGDIVEPELMNAREGPELLSWIFWFAGWSTQECLSADQARLFAVMILAVKFGMETADWSILSTVWEKIVRILFLSFSHSTQALQRLKVSGFEEFEGGFYSTSETSITWFSHREIEMATGMFSTKIGAGAVNEVFIGRLSDGRTVAVKKLRKLRADTLKEVVKEVRIQRRLVKSEQLCSMVGFCLDQEDPLLVYEYVPYCSLKQVLEGAHEPSDQSGDGLGGLIWGARLQIGIDVANAIKQLHDQQVYHCNVKSSNILLTNPSRGYAKLGDFRVTVEVPKGSGGWVYPGSKGTRRNSDPHQKAGGRILTEKSDVYGLGVVLLELVTGQKAWDPRRRPILLPKLVTSKMKQGKLSEVIDPYVWVPCNVCRKICKYCLDKMVLDVLDLAIECCCPCPNHRPSIADVLQRLLDIQIVGAKSVFLV